MANIAAAFTGLMLCCPTPFEGGTPCRRVVDGVFRRDGGFAALRRPGASPSRKFTFQENEDVKPSVDYPSSVDIAEGTKAVDFLFATPKAIERLIACSPDKSFSVTDWIAIAAIVFSVAIALAVYRLQDRDSKRRDEQQSAQARVSTALELHREYNARAFADARSEARKFVRKNSHRGEEWVKTASFSEWDNPGEEQAAKAAALHEVMRFFHKWGALAKTGRVDANIAFELLGWDLAWWNGFAFEAMKDRKRSRTLQSIHFLVESMHVRPDAQDWQHWVDEGFQERQKT
jgi:hypothetical protein